MLHRVVLKSLTNRKSRILVAAAAVLLGASLVAMLTSLSLDTGSKAGEQLRAYGANITLAPREATALVGMGGIEFGEVRDESYLFERDLASLNTGELRQDVVGYAPYLYGLVEVHGRRHLLTGVWFDRVQQLSPWWKVSGQWAGNDDQVAAMVGKTAATNLQLQLGDRLLVRSEFESRELVVKGIVETGDPEDDQLFVSLRTAQAIMAKPGSVSIVRISAMTDRRPLASIAADVEKRIPNTSAKIVGQIAEAEAGVLDSIRLLIGLVATLVLLASGLAVGSTMTTSVLERAKEIGLMKSLGARDTRIVAIFLGETAVIGVLGGIFGYVAGIFLVQLIGRAVFGSSISFNWLAIPATLGSAIAVSFLASILPVRRALTIDPIITLRGD